MCLYSHQVSLCFKDFSITQWPRQKTKQENTVSQLSYRKWQGTVWTDHQSVDRKPFTCTANLELELPVNLTYACLWTVGRS